MLRFALILILISLNFGCALPGPFNDFTTHYTQSLIPCKWSEDQKSLYLTYGTFNKEHRSNYYVLKLDIETKKYAYLYQSVGGDSLYLDVSTQDDSVFTSRINQNEIHQIKEGKDTVFAQGKLLRAMFGDIFQNKFLTYHTTDLSPDQRPLNTWGLYDDQIKEFQEIQQHPIAIENIEYAQPYQNKLYFTNDLIRSNLPRNFEDRHAWGTLDTRQAKLIETKIIPEYKENGLLRFWAWLSENEILFSVIDERGRYLETVSYNLSSGSYQTRAEFSQQGLLSPQRDRVAFVKGDFLITSAIGGTKPQRILNIRQDLPKGDPQFLE